MEAGNEIHHKAGLKIVIEAGAEVTLKAGGSFVKVDPSGVTISGPLVRMNSGGGPGSGSAVSAQTPQAPSVVAANETVSGNVDALAVTETRPAATPQASPTFKLREATRDDALLSHLKRAGCGRPSLSGAQRAL